MPIECFPCPTCPRAPRARHTHLCRHVDITSRVHASFAHRASCRHLRLSRRCLYRLLLCAVSSLWASPLHVNFSLSRPLVIPLSPFLRSLSVHHLTRSPASHHFLFFPLCLHLIHLFFISRLPILPHPFFSLSSPPNSNPLTLSSTCPPLPVPRSSLFCLPLFLTPIFSPFPHRLSPPFSTRFPLCSQISPSCTLFPPRIRFDRCVLSSSTLCRLYSLRLYSHHLSHTPLSRLFSATCAVSPRSTSPSLP